MEPELAGGQQEWVLGPRVVVPLKGGLGGLTGPGVGRDFEALVLEFRGVALKPRPCVLFCLWGPGLGTGGITCDTPSAHWYQALAQGVGPWGRGPLGVGPCQEEPDPYFPLTGSWMGACNSLALGLGLVEVRLSWEGHCSACPTPMGPSLVCGMGTLRVPPHVLPKGRVTGGM